MRILLVEDDAMIAGAVSVALKNAVIEIVDNGPGIPVSERDRVLGRC